MKFIELDRQRGKTTGCIAWLCGSDERCLIIFTQRERDRLASAYPVVAARIYTLHDFRARSFGKKFTEVGIDNLDLLLSDLLGLPVTMATANPGKS